MPSTEFLFTLGATKRPALSIVMPVRNEALSLGAVLAALEPLLGRGAELVVVDGGSTDGTLALAQTFCDAQSATVLVSDPGRAMQMNAGARLAAADVLLFLHADTYLPPDADGLIASALARNGAVWGRFDVQIEGQSPWLRVVAMLMNWRSRYTGIATGDQALFMTRAAFDQTGGFADQALMEDIEMSSRLRRMSAPACLRAQVRTSGRRWDSRGVWRTVGLMWCLRLAYGLGVSPSRLAAWYR